MNSLDIYRHREPPSGGAGDWEKKAWPRGTAMTRHREEPPGVCEGRRRGDLRLSMGDLS
ncbi:MAG TPA: hypothetical protein PLY86_08115 [bacterium]|nr:hypothetical protein [bacterium]